MKPYPLKGLPSLGIFLFEVMNMEERTDQKAWRMEVSNPLEPISKWRTVFKFNEDELRGIGERRSIK